MFSWTRSLPGFRVSGRGITPVVHVALGAAFCAFAATTAAERAPVAHDVGRAATPAEIQAWNIDVRPDFKGLPRGSGTVDQGMNLWESTCASCHGAFAESNSVFTPLVGGTTHEDIETGNVAALTKGGQPSRTTFMKVPTISTLWDYIHRAMPWDHPKSLKPDDVYAVLAYLLNLADIVPADFTLSNENIAQVQEKMPNRNGMKFWDGLWRVDGKPDTHNTACMANCDATGVPSSTIPEHARDAHGDLAAQMRVIGPVRGADTTKPPLTGPVDGNLEQVRAHARATLAASASVVAPTGVAASESATRQRVEKSLADNGCMACHAKDKKILGPSFADVARKYKGQPDAVEKLVTKIQKGGAGVWGPIPMPPHPNLSSTDAKAMVDWIRSLEP